MPRNPELSQVVTEPNQHARYVLGVASSESIDVINFNETRIQLKEFKIVSDTTYMAP